MRRSTLSTQTWHQCGRFPYLLRAQHLLAQRRSSRRRVGMSARTPAGRKGAHGETAQPRAAWHRSVPKTCCRLLQANTSALTARLVCGRVGRTPSSALPWRAQAGLDSGVNGSGNSMIGQIGVYRRAKSPARTRRRRSLHSKLCVVGHRLATAKRVPLTSNTHYLYLQLAPLKQESSKLIQELRLLVQRELRNNDAHDHIHGDSRFADQ